MKIRMKMGVSGTFHNMDGGVVVGQVVDIDDVEAQRYIDLGYAEAANQGRRSEEHAVQQFSEEERAVLATEIVGASDKVIPQPKVPKEPKAKENVEVQIGDGKAEEKVQPEKPKPVYGKTHPPGEAKRGPGRPRKSS